MATVGGIECQLSGEYSHGVGPKMKDRKKYRTTEQILKTTTGTSSCAIRVFTIDAVQKFN